ncbi:hypothetical protein [Yersinia phage vB_YenM_P778]
MAQVQHAAATSSVRSTVSVIRLTLHLSLQTLMAALRLTAHLSLRKMILHVYFNIPEPAYIGRFFISGEHQ